MLVPCTRCRRHIRIRDEVCRFCHAIVLSAGVLLGGCDAGDKPATRDPQSAAPPPAMPHATAISGIVTDRKNQPLVGARVELRDETSKAIRTASADGTGRYVLDPSPPGAYVIVIEYSAVEGGMQRNGRHERTVTVAHGEPAKVLDVAVDVHEHSVAPPYGAPPARRRVV